MSGRAENLHIGLTFCALSNGKFSFQSQKFSATDLGGDLVDALLIIEEMKQCIQTNSNNNYRANLTKMLLK